MKERTAVKRNTACGPNRLSMDIDLPSKQVSGLALSCPTNFDKQEGLRVW